MTKKNFSQRKTLFILIVLSILTNINLKGQVILSGFNNPAGPSSPSTPIPCNSTFYNNGIPIQGCNIAYSGWYGALDFGELSIDVSSISSISSVSFSFFHDDSVTNDTLSLARIEFLSSGNTVDSLLVSAYGSTFIGSYYNNINNFQIDEIKIESEYSVATSLFTVAINSCSFQYELFTNTTTCGADNGIAEVITSHDDIKDVKWYSTIDRGNLSYELLGGYPYAVEVTDAYDCTDIKYFTVFDEWSATNSSQKATNQNTTINDKFGESVAINGNWAAVGAFRDDENGVNSGSVYLYRRNGYSWEFYQQLLPPQVEDDDRFGESIAIGKDHILVGARTDDDMGSNSGAVYAYQLVGLTWQPTQKLHASDALSGTNFGHDIAIDGNTVIISASRDDETASNAGSAYIFELSNDTWTEKQKILASDGQDSDRFGFSVDISGRNVIVGTGFDDDMGLDAGSAYIFSYDVGTQIWSQKTKLIPSNLAVDDRFGLSVAIHDGSAIVSAPFRDVQGTNVGTAYIYQYDIPSANWIQNQQITPSNIDSGDIFGLDVDMSQNRILIGSRGYNGNKGAAFYYKYNGSTWQLDQQITESTITTNDNFGTAVAIDGDDIIIGARQDDEVATDAGAVYFYKMPNSSGDSDLDGLCDNTDSCPNNFFVTIPNDCYCYETCQEVEYQADDYFSGDGYFIQASERVNGSNKINAGANIIYTGGKEVNLFQGFEVKLGAEFEAFIAPCHIVCQ